MKNKISIICIICIICMICMTSVSAETNLTTQNYYDIKDMSNDLLRISTGTFNPYSLILDLFANMVYWREMYFNSIKTRNEYYKLKSLCQCHCSPTSCPTLSCEEPEKECWIDGDVDCDGTITFGDFQILQSNFLRDDCEESNDWCSHCDFNKDGIVDVTDFNKIEAILDE